jgi:type II secretory pathway pseudopilin PulG
MSRQHTHRRGFTLVEALVIVVLAVLIAAILLPVFGRARRSARKFVSTGDQTRGIHTALVLYAQGNGAYYPGFDKDGNVVDLTVEYRFRELLEDNYFTGEYAISPSETLHPWTQGPVSTANYSYAMLQVDVPVAGGRRVEWRETTNKLAPVLSDRAIPNGSGAIKSLHTNPAPGVTEWRGSVAWNDDHVTFENVTSLTTQYGSTDNKNDDLFTAASDSDAWMIYTGSSGMGW